MKQVTLKVDILSKHLVSHPIYRIYVDYDMIVERTYGWPEEHYVEENIIVNVPQGPHILTVEHPNANFESNFELRDFRVNGQPANIVANECIFLVDDSFPAAA